MMAAGLRATAKAVEHPPEPKIGAPVLDPTATDCSGPMLLKNSPGKGLLVGSLDEVTG
jgi:hypothetical protein